MAANSSEHRCTKEMKGKEINVHVYECTLHTGAKNEGKGGKRVGGEKIASGLTKAEAEAEA